MRAAAVLILLPFIVTFSRAMKSVIRNIKQFFTSMGLVEQSQVVASTAVIVAMAVIVTVHFFIGERLGWLDFVSVVTVGVIGYVSVYFSLKYGRMLEEQRKELLELNTIAEAVNHSMDLNLVLRSALEKVMELMHADCGWIYLREGDRLILRYQHGTNDPFFRAGCSTDDPALRWIWQPGMLSADDPLILASAQDDFRGDGILASIPLVRNGVFAGVMVIAGREAKNFSAKKIALIQAFGNQISVALNNASLFEQVKQSEGLYVDLYEHSPDMYHSVDRDGIVVSCNQTESQLLGLPKEQIVGKPLLRLFPESQHHRVREDLLRIFEFGEELKGVEERLLRADGSLIDVSVSASLVYGPDRRPTIARIVMRDITEKKKMEERLLQVQKIDSIGNLAGGIAHDFNNILTAILGSASMMRRKMSGEEQSMKYVDLIETTSRRGAAITRQLLTFARKNNPHVHLVDVNAILDQTLKLFEATTSKNIVIKCTLSQESAIVNGDEGQLQQAVLNLCLNARDAMPSGGVLVINCKPFTMTEQFAAQFTDGRPGEYIMVSIADSGTGIPPQILNKIYEPFFTTKDQGKGTGLGLSVVYGVVRSHQAQITVNSELNSGTMFTMYFPRVTEIKSLHPAGKKEEKMVGGTERILLVEDEISIGEVGTDLLTDLGYRVEIARNGRDAIDMLMDPARAFDLVILDMNMPRMGGKETFDRIKEVRPNLKILICSGYSATMLDDSIFTRTIDGFIQKPYEIDNFSRKIRNILDTPSRSIIGA
jgi:PAS domain S-box-containing protein